jgi:hypothetical protein
MPIISDTGGRDPEDYGSSKPIPESSQDPLQSIKLSMVVYICYPSYAGSLNRKIVVQVSVDKTMRSLSEK